MDDDYAADDVELDADAEGELEQQGGSPGMTLVDAGGLSALGVPPPSSGASSALGGGGAGGGNGGVGKRYRPAPAKTFQCRGYGECRMVFSRSEHLARHVRKHTGERPFTCHCSKQFSRLDNLRQHAQTVHADKAALNEGMMRELTSLHVSMAGGAAAAASASADTAPVAAAAGKKKGGKAAKGDAKEDEGKRPTSKRAKPSAGGAGGPVKREPVDEQPLVLGGSGGMAQRPGTSTGYEGAAVAGYMDVDGDGDEPSTQRRQQRQTHEKPSPPSARAHSFRDAQQQQSFRDSTSSFRSPSGDEPAHFFRADGAFREHPNAGAEREERQSFRAAGGFREGGFRDANGGFRADGGAGGRAGAGVFRDREREGGAAAAAGASASANTHSGGRQDSFRGVGPQYVRRSPPAHTPSPPTPSFGGNGLPAHRVASGGFSTGRPFSSGNGSFPAAHADSVPPGSSPSSFPALNGFPSSGSRPSTGSGARLPPLSAVVSASAFRPSSGHGLPAPGVGAGGSILLPNSLTLRRPFTSDWEWGDAWNVRPGTAPGKLATAAAGVADDSPFSFHPPEQPASSGNFGFGFSAGGGAGGSAHGNPRKRTLGGPDGPYGAHTDGGDGGYEYGGESRPQSRRLSVMELCNDEQQQRPASSSLSASVSAALRRSGSAERERPTTTNGLVSRASALVLHDGDQRDYDYERERESQREHESRQYAAEQQHLAAERERERFPAIYGIGLGLGRHRAGSLRGLDAAAPGGAAATGARPATGGHGRGDGSGVSAAAGGGAAFLSAAAGGAGAPHRGGALSSTAAASAAPAGGVPRTVRASPPAAAARARDEHGLDGVGHGDDGGVSPSARAYGGGGRVSLSPPAGAGAYRGGGGPAGAGLPGGFGGVPHAHAPASPTSPTSPTRADAYRDSASPPASALRGGLLPGVAVFARVPAYAAAAGGVPLRGDDAVRFDDGIRYAAGGRGAEVRGGAAGAGHGPGGGYEYEYGDEYGEHGHGRRVGGGRSGGMRV